MFDLIKANFAKHIELNPAETDFVLSLLKSRTLNKKKRSIPEVTSIWESI